MHTFASRFGLAVVLAVLLPAGCASSGSEHASLPTAKRFKAQIDEQRPEEIALPDTVYDRADPMPRPLNYQEAYSTLLKYPSDVRDVTGRVVVQFIVTGDGWTTEPKVVQGVHPDLDAEALELVRYLRFEPGRRNGTSVAVRMRLPLSFSRPDLN